MNVGTAEDGRGPAGKKMEPTPTALEEANRQVQLADEAFKVFERIMKLALGRVDVLLAAVGAALLVGCVLIQAIGEANNVSELSPTEFVTTMVVGAVLMVAGAASRVYLVKLMKDPDWLER